MVKLSEKETEKFLGGIKFKNKENKNEAYERVSEKMAISGLEFAKNIHVIEIDLQPGELENTKMASSLPN